MLKRLVNEARFALTITTTGPLLIKSGYATLTGPDMTPVLTLRNGQAQVFIPGSSLKGVFRSHIEKVIRSVRPNDIVVADPFKREGDPDQSVSAWLQQRKRGGETIDNPVAYADSDPVARLFGSTFYSGRVSIGDAYLYDPSTGAYYEDMGRGQRLPTEQRDGVGIDRLTGGAVNRAKFELEVVSTGTIFRADVLLRNFECWQLGALLLVAQDMEDELIRLGSGKSRGLGAVRGAVDQITVHHLGSTPGRGAAEIWGLGRFLGPDSPYGTRDDDTLTIDSAPTTSTSGIRAIQIWSDTDLASLKRQTAQEFVRRMEAFPAYTRTTRRRAG